MLEQLADRAARWPKLLRDRLDRARLADGTMLALAGVTGVATGALAAALIGLIALMQRLAFGGDVATWELVAVPALGGVVVWALLRAAPDAAGGGIAQTMEAAVLSPGRLRLRLAGAKTLAAGVALGAGLSGGREGPIVHIGGSIGSSVGRRFHLGDEQVRSLVAAGAAAGIGAVFNAPIGGMLFAIEVIVGGLRSRSLQVIVVSSVAGSVVARQLVGESIVYAPAIDYRLGDPRELLLHLLVGLAAGLLGVALARSVRAAPELLAPVRRRLGGLGALALAGLGVGLVALAVPQVLGDGEQLPPVEGVRAPIQALIDGAYGATWEAVGLVLLLAAAKYVATMLTLGARAPIGSFAPTLLLGACLGTAVAIPAELLTGADVAPGAYALVGMAAAYGATARAPLTSVLIVFELTGSYGLVLPLMLAVGAATFLAERLEPHSAYTGPLADRGIVYSQPDDVDLLQTVLVAEVMTESHPVVAPELPLPELRARFDEQRTHGFAVVDGGRLVGVVTLADLADGDALGAASPRGEAGVTVGDLMSADAVTCRPDEEVFRALRRMVAIDVGRVPVVDDEGRYLAMLRRGDLVDAYRAALGRGVDQQVEAEESRLRDLTGVLFVELHVAEGSAADGATIAELDWPTSTVVTAVRRGPDLRTPRGDTTLRTGDELVLLAAHDDVDAARALLGVDAGESP